MAIIPESGDAHKPPLFRPRLRPVEAFPVSTDQGEMICLRDPERLAPGPLFLSPAAAALLGLLDGRHDLRDIQAALMKVFGELVELEIIKGLVQTLDENRFLDSEQFQSFLAAETERFASSRSRAPLLAGQAYPDDPEELAHFLAAFHRHPTGPRQQTSPAGQPPPCGLVAPHIDFNRGGPCYAWAYSLLCPENQPDLTVILGTAHGPTEHYLVMCDKDFETPAGAACCDREAAAALTSELGTAVTAEQFVHRGEHSVEFHAVWLMNTCGPGGSMKILPLLCGSFQSLIMNGLTPEEDPEYVAMADALGRIIQSRRAAGGRVLILASADLSHVGPQFGDRLPVSESVRADVRAHDMHVLEAAADGDCREFYRRVARQRDRTHICGTAPIYTMLRLMGGAKGRLLSYDQWVDEQGQGLVSFASLVFD